MNKCKSVGTFLISLSPCVYRRPNSEDVKDTRSSVARPSLVKTPPLPTILWLYLCGYPIAEKPPPRWPFKGHLALCWPPRCCGCFLPNWKSTQHAAGRSKLRRCPKARGRRSTTRRRLRRLPSDQGSDGQVKGSRHRFWLLKAFGLSQCADYRSKTDRQWHLMCSILSARNLLFFTRLCLEKLTKARSELCASLTDWTNERS